MTQRNNFDTRPIRPMIQFVPQQDDTTEARLKDVRKQMVLTRAKKTIRNTGHYFTEPYPACGECEFGTVASYLE